MKIFTRKTPENRRNYIMKIPTYAIMYIVYMDMDMYESHSHVIIAISTCNICWLCVLFSILIFPCLLLWTPEYSVFLTRARHRFVFIEFVYIVFIESCNSSICLKNAINTWMFFFFLYFSSGRSRSEEELIQCAMPPLYSHGTISIFAL